MTLDSEEENHSQTPAEITNGIIAPVKFRKSAINRLTKEENRLSFPLLSIHNAHHTNQVSVVNDDASENFEETMKLNAPFISRSKSPKSRHKSRSHHNKTASAIPQKSLSVFNVEDDFTRSYSDSAIQLTHHNRSSNSNDISQWNYVKPREFRRSTVIEHKNGDTACHTITTSVNSSLEDVSVRIPVSGIMNLSENLDKKENEMSAERSLDKLYLKNFQMSNVIYNSESMLPRIEEFEKMCQQNYQNVVSEIQSEFDTLAEMVDKRKKELLNTATMTYQRKLSSLNELKSKWEDRNVSDYSIEKNGPLSLHSVPLQNSFEQNGFKEPWEEVTKSGCIDSVSNMEATLPTSEKYPSLKLDEGNLTFDLDKTNYHFISSLGKIEENLSSPQYSFLSGYPQGNILVGDTVNLQVHTLNMDDEETYNSKDEVKLNIYDEKKKKVNLESIPDIAQKLEHILLFAEGNNDLGSEQKNHSYTFKPTKPGRYDVVVKLNGVEIKSSPYSCVVYAKRSLTFENHITGARPHRSLSSDCDDVENCEQHDWIVKKGGKSCLLRTQGDKICHIYAKQVVQNTNAWKIRLTCACVEIMFNIGVATRTSVPQLDEQFSCQFYLKDFNKKIIRDRNLKRRESQFTRPPITFSILLSDWFLRVTSHELDEDKNVAVKLSIDKSNKLYPFCSVVHCHDDLFSQVCPSPQITFL